MFGHKEMEKLMNNWMLLKIVSIREYLLRLSYFLSVNMAKMNIHMLLYPCIGFNETMIDPLLYQDSLNHNLSDSLC